jgi:predicted AlkP superfamily pyrophosphatase or phosphodiesterase
MRTVIVLLIDGLSRKMIDSVPTPNFARIRSEGASTDHLEPVFPSISEPNWVSASTGCWPENHGLVSAQFIDPEMGLFNHDVDADWLSGGELLHQVAERQGVRTAALGWYGRYSKSRGALATYVSDERKVPWTLSEYASERKRTDDIIEYLRMPDERRPRLILGYFAQPDEVVHAHGIDSQQARDAIVGADAEVGRLLDTIARLPYGGEVTLLAMSDHGHLPVTHLINVRRVLTRHSIRARDVTTGTTSFLHFDDRSQIDRACEALAGYREFSVIERDRPPQFAHLGTGERVGDLILSAHQGYYMVDPVMAPWYLKPLATMGRDIYPSPFMGVGLVSAHGYPPDTPGIQGILYAWGSGVARSREIKGARMIDIHPTVTRLLEIEPGRPIDGAAIESLAA